MTNSQASPSPVDALKLADQLISNEQAEQAIKGLSAFLEDRDNPHVWMKLAAAYQILGEATIARAILRNVVLKLRDPHIVDVIAARIPYAKLVVVDKLRLLYFSIPKCGSSSVKDALLLATGEQRKGESSHFHISHLTKVLPFKELDESFADWQSAAIVREPRARIRSYWSKNVRQGSLKKEARGKDSYYGLPTMPSYELILSDFRRYRDVFRDCRHHTDTIVGYIGRVPGRAKHLFDVSETRKVIAIIEELSGMQMPDIHNMRSAEPFNSATPEAVDLEDSILATFYREETALYFTDSRRLTCHRPNG